MLLSSEAGPQRRHGGVAQPQNSMKESLTDITLLQTIDRTAQCSRASTSSKSTSLELLLVSCTSSSASLSCAAETGAAAQLERAALRRPVFSAAQRWVPAAHSLSPELSHQGGERRQLPPRMSILSSVPCTADDTAGGAQAPAAEPEARVRATGRGARTNVGTIQRTNG